MHAILEKHSLPLGAAACCTHTRTHTHTHTRTHTHTHTHTYGSCYLNYDKASYDFDKANNSYTANCTGNPFEFHDTSTRWGEGRAATKLHTSARSTHPPIPIPTPSPTPTPTPTPTDPFRHPQTHSNIFRPIQTSTRYALTIQGTSTRWGKGRAAAQHKLHKSARADPFKHPHAMHSPSKARAHTGVKAGQQPSTSCTQAHAQTRSNIHTLCTHHPRHEHALG